NNAAAVLLVLSAVAQGREVIISRGEMIEIGGAFRIPEVMAQSGCILREVGTTNRTHLRDYEEAIGENTAAILKVHPSNYRVVGFTASVSTRELAALAHKRGLLLIEDLGSGVLVPTERYGLAHEPTVQETVAAGADLVTFSGDKLLGGPQAGIIVGRKELVERCRRHPLARAVRVDKLTLAALQATLQHYLDGTVEQIPIYRMLACTADELRRRAESVRARVLERLAAGRKAEAGRMLAAGAGERSPGAGELFDIQVVSTVSTVGGGSLPGEGQPSAAVAVTFRGATAADAVARAAPAPEDAAAAPAATAGAGRNSVPVSDHALAAALRRHQPPVLGPIRETSRPRAGGDDVYVIGTAGHIDHGKTTLSRVLTNIDPDRLKEEQARGMTIDLGFAWLTLPSGREAGIVDVPGHHRFIRNMLAGVGGIRLVLFVVAANESWMPQSQEHLEILDLLGVDRGIVVLTKSDLVDPE